VSASVRFPVLSAAALSAFALSGCGGANLSLPASGGAQGVGARSARGAQAGPQVSQVTNPYPFAQGDVFDYNYAKTTVTTTGGSSATTYDDGTTVVTIEGQQQFDGQELTEVSEVYTYVKSNGSKQKTASGTLTTDYYREFASANGGLDYLQYGYTTAENETETDGSSIASSTLYTYTDPLLIDVIPEVKSNWKLDIPNTQSGNETTTASGGSSTGNSYTFTRKSDLSYDRTTDFYIDGAKVCSATQSEAKNGSGSDDNTCSKSSDYGTTTFSAPAKSGSKYFITVVYTPPGGSKTTTQVPDWFPGAGPVKALVTSTKKDTGIVKVPSSCGKYVAGQKGAELVESDSILDALEGTYYTFTETTYIVSGEGRVCVIDKDATDTYDYRDTGALTTSVSESSVAGLTGETLQQMRTKGLIVGFPQGKSRPD